MKRNSARTMATVVILAAAVSLSVVLAMGSKPDKDDSTPTANEDTPAGVATKVVAVPVEAIYGDHQCSVQQAQVRWVESAEAYETLYQSLRNTYVGESGGVAPEVDWGQYGVLLVAMGQQRTGGYGVDLAAKEAPIDNGVLQVTVNWREPQKGMMVTQALTSPCMLLKIAAAPFERIEIKDQSGAIRLSGSR